MVAQTVVLLFVIMSFSAGLISGIYSGRHSHDDSMRRVWSVLSDTCRAEIDAAARDEDVMGRRR